MASKTGIMLLLALLGAALFLQVAVADEAVTGEHDSAMTSRASDLDEVADQQEVEFDESTVEDPEAATDEPDADSDNGAVEAQEEEATDMAEDSEDSEVQVGYRPLARLLHERSKRCSKKKHCKKIYAKPGCCHKKCTNLLKDSKHCGKCGHKCNTKKGYVCHKGCCKKPKKHHHRCPHGKKRCKGKCIDKEDYYHCGNCGHRCHYGKKCCHGKCVNLHKDSKNCGRCGKECGSGIKCSYGLCGYSA